ncbi:MAG: hypothetical protein LBF97_05940 [Elusimicrobiota bacterium]|jgi:hypothetical protein|nr:hypothetical protein [Elusimicrobiota bacterium]
MKFEKTDNIKRLFEVIDRIFKNVENNDIVYYGSVKENIKLVSFQPSENANNENIIYCNNLNKDYIELKNKNYIFCCGNNNNKPMFDFFISFLKDVNNEDLTRIIDVQIGESYCNVLISDYPINKDTLEIIFEIMKYEIKEDIISEEDNLTYNNLTSFLHYYNIPITYKTIFFTIKKFNNEKIKNIIKSDYFKSFTK